MKMNVEESVALAELKNSLERYIVKGSTISSEVIDDVLTETRTVLVTPSLAETLLTRNNKNRPVNNANVNKLAYAMTNGEWLFNGSLLTFDMHGNLLDGQHRLMAVIKSGKSVPFKISTGFKSEVFSTIDINKVRSSSDILAIAGVSNYQLCASTANFIFQFMRGSINDSASKSSRQLSRPNKGLTHKELLKFVEVKPNLKTSVEYQLSIRKQQPMAILPAHVVSGFHFLFSEKDEDLATTFLNQLLVGDKLSNESSVYHLRNILIKSKMDSTKRIIHSDMIKLVVNAWNLFKKGKKVKSLSIPDTLPMIN